MKKGMRNLFGGIGLLCLFLLGCGKEQIVIDADESRFLQMEAGGQETEEVIEEEERGFQSEEAKPSVSEEEETIWVHICGEVNKPGVYQFSKGLRIWDALQAAGGVTENGEGDYLNQAAPLEDGMKITVPTKEQAKQWESSGETGIREVGGEEIGGLTGDGGKVNLNTADIPTLCTLPGIGESRARSIIDYREENGPFLRVEDIMKVSGIKEAAFKKIKEYIVV